MYPFIADVKKCLENNHILDSLNELIAIIDIHNGSRFRNNASVDLGNNLRLFKIQFQQTDSDYLRQLISRDEFMKERARVITGILKLIDPFNNLPNLDQAITKRETTINQGEASHIELNIDQSFHTYTQEDINILVNIISQKIGLPSSDWVILVRRTPGSVKLVLKLPSFFVVRLFVFVIEGQLRKFHVVDADLSLNDDPKLRLDIQELPDLRFLGSTTFGNILSPVSYLGNPPEVEIDQNRTAWANGLEIRINQHPPIVELDKIYLENHRDLPENLKLFFSKYRPLMITHSLSLHCWEEGDYITSWGGEVHFEGENQIYPIDLAPKTSIDHDSNLLPIELDAYGRFLGINSENNMSSQEKSKSKVGQLEFSASDEDFKVGSFYLPTPFLPLTTLNTSSDRISWVYQADVKRSLFGEQLCLQTIWIPRTIHVVSFFIRSFVLIRSPWHPVPGRYETEWDEISIPLD